MRFFLATFIVLLISACDSGLSGRYSDESGLAAYIFDPDGTVIISTFGTNMETQYSMDDDLVKIQAPGGGTLVFPVMEDGSLQGPGGIKLRPQDG